MGALTAGVTDRPTRAQTMTSILVLLMTRACLQYHLTGESSPAIVRTVQDQN